LAHITRKELRRDEFATEVSKTYEFLQRQRAGLLRWGAAAGVLLVLAAGVYFFLNYRQSRAGEELSHAMRVFYSPLTTDITQSEPEMKFADSKTRYTQAEKEFSAVATKYSWLGPGRMARYYLGLTKRELGNREAAVSELSAIAAGDDDLAGLAKFALAETHAQAGRIAEAEKLFRELAARPVNVVPKENALMALADHLGPIKPAEAEKIYAEVQKLDPKSSAAGEAGRRLMELKLKK